MTPISVNVAIVHFGLSVRRTKDELRSRHRLLDLDLVFEESVHFVPIFRFNIEEEVDEVINRLLRVQSNILFPNHRHCTGNERGFHVGIGLQRKPYRAARFECCFEKIVGKSLFESAQVKSAFWTRFFQSEHKCERLPFRRESHFARKTEVAVVFFVPPCTSNEFGRLVRLCLDRKGINFP